MSWGVLIDKKNFVLKVKQNEKNKKQSDEKNLVVPNLTCLSF